MPNHELVAGSCCTRARPPRKNFSTSVERKVRHALRQSYLSPNQDYRFRNCAAD
jgi:hypothetical protein